MKSLVFILFSLGFMALGGYVLFNYTMYGKELFHDADELSGIVLSVVLGFNFLLFFGILVLKINIPNKDSFKKVVQFLYKCHTRVGVLAVGLLVLHACVALNVNKLLNFNHITGYILTLLIVASVIAISISRSKKVHVGLALTALVPFFLHVV